MGEIECVTASSADEQTMAAARALKAAKRELRNVMKERLSAIPQASIEKQSISSP
jgi:hypothetical protein